jgi:hypothetical protein
MSVLALYGPVVWQQFGGRPMPAARADVAYDSSFTSLFGTSAVTRSSRAHHAPFIRWWPITVIGRPSGCPMASGPLQAVIVPIVV